MLSDRWEDVVSNIAVGMGYELIDLELDDSGLVRIFIDIVDNTRDVSVNDCELLTRQLLYQLPVENLAFERLEVS
ncbi:MAG: ribosome maturation factor RimP, partial [Burkholderiaceae bacterium]